MASSKPLVVFIMLYLSFMVSGHRGMVGGRTEVRDVKSNEEVQELGRFSVKEFNRQQQLPHNQHGHNGEVNHGGVVPGELAFSKVVEAQKLVVSGLKYYLKIEATTGSGETLVFDSVVVVKPWLHSMVLLHFAPSLALRVRK